MMKTEKRLNPKALEQVVKAKRPGMYHDGRGLTSTSARPVGCPGCSGIGSRASLATWG